jgi:hypothetical protein
MPDSLNERNSSAKFLNQAIAKSFNDSEIQLIQRRHFNEKLGAELVRRYISIEVSNIDNSAYKK